MRQTMCALLSLAALLAGSGMAHAQTPTPPAPPQQIMQQPQAASPVMQGVMSLQATYAGTGRPVGRDLSWRVYQVSAGEPSLVASSNDPRPNFALPPGDYIIHVTHGLAAATKRIPMQSRPVSDRLQLNAGGLVLRAKLADVPIQSERQSISIYIPAPNDSEAKLVTKTLKAGELLRLPEGQYHVVSTYAGSNSVVRADINVQSGKVTEATINHRAATVTLKLVRQQGGVAIANTSWTVQTPGGDIISEALGAFPTMELAEGEYDVVARNDGREYKDKVKVVSGVNRDHEVVMR